MLRNDQLYEERAIDVVPGHQQSYRKNNDPKFRDDKKNVARTRPRSSGTVRSIPIKHYQASLAHNIGTLRRSEAPQLQFESSISEPEKNLHVSKYRTTPMNSICFVQDDTGRVSQLPRLIRASKSSEMVNPSRRSCHSCDTLREVQNGSGRINSKLKTLDRRIARSEHNVSMREGDQDFSDFDDYFHKSNSRRLNSRQSSGDRKARDQLSNAQDENGTRRLKDGETRAGKKWGTIHLERGHVGQKISAYEENARRSGRNWDSSDKYQASPEAKKHRAIGVPLVGMHNACGLPVIASWHDHELLRSLRVGSKVLGTLRPIFKGSRASFDLNHRTHPKRKAPQPVQNTFKKNRSVRSRNSDRKDYPSIRSLVSLDAGSGGVRKRRRRASLKMRRTGTNSAKNSVKRKEMSSTRRNKENSLADENRRKSMETENAKRQTLYARDDGEDAVQVLKTLCLNPLARTKSETDMIW